MKRIYTLLSCVAVTSALVAGVTNPNMVKRSVLGAKTAAVVSVEKTGAALSTNPASNNAMQAVPFYTEDFASGTTTTLPAGWGVSNSAGTTANWKWKIGGSTGANGVPALAASAGNTTPANGSMIYDSDALCTTSGVSAIANLTSSAISCTGHSTVKLTFFESYIRFRDTTYLEVSIDSTTWTRFAIPLNDAIATNSAAPNPAKVGVNITSVAANQASVFLRFVFKGGSTAGCDYGWIVDDISLSELPNNDLALVKEFYDVTNGSTPKSQLDSIFFGGRVANVGATAQAATMLNAKVKANNGTTLHNTNSANVNLAANTDSLIDCANGFLPSTVGTYRIVYKTMNDTVTDENLVDNSDSTQFQVSDSTFLSTIVGYSGGYFLYNSANTDQFNWGLIFDVLNTDTLTSVSFASRTATTANQTYAFELHKFENDAWSSLGTVQKLVAANEISAAAGAIKDIKKAFVIDDKYMILDPGTYAMTISAVTLSATATILGSTTYPENSTPVIYDANETIPFSLTSIAPYLKVNFGKPNPFLGIADYKKVSNVSVFPNPTTNLLNVKMEQTNNATIKMTNINGQVVFAENVSNKNNATIDMSLFAKGIYSLQIISDKGIETKKVVKQ